MKYKKIRILLKTERDVGDCVAKHLRGGWEFLSEDAGSDIGISGYRTLSTAELTFWHKEFIGPGPWDDIQVIEEDLALREHELIWEEFRHVETWRKVTAKYLNRLARWLIKGDYE